MLAPIKCHLFSARNAPNGVANIIGNNQRPSLVDSQPDWTSVYGVAGSPEAGDDILCQAGGLTVPERHEHDLIAANGGSVPAAVLPHEHAAAVASRQRGLIVPSDTDCRDMRAERVIGPDRLGDEVGLLRHHTWVEMLAVITVRPTVKGPSLTDVM